MELAASWERASRTERGLPEPVARVLDMHPATQGSQLLFGAPEHRVALPGGSRASQTDMWALLRTPTGLVSMAVEGKAREAFGPTLDEWRREASEGKHRRLKALCETLGLAMPDESDLRYQLFHRAASAVLEASRAGARTAVLLVQSFYPATVAWPDFQAFTRLFRVEACRDGICEVRCPELDRLLLAWVDSTVATDSELAGLV
jgi:hypothetical protein